MVVKILDKDIILEDKLVDKYNQYGQLFIPKQYEHLLLKKKIITEESSEDVIKTELLSLMKEDLSAFKSFKNLIETP